MKKILCAMLAVLVLLGSTGCAAGKTESAQQPAAEIAAEPAAMQLPAETAEPAYEGSLFLKASSVTLSVVGETDDIYLGMIPREEVTFESDDESVVTFENGVLTAVGVGNTTVRAIYRDQQMECAAGCLAQTREELEAMDPEILRSPKRLPPAVDLEAECTDFAEAAIIGDSITYFMFQWESKYDYLGEVTFLARGGVSLNGFILRSKNVFFRGKERYLEDAIAEAGVKKIYVMLGQNDLSSKARTKIMDNWVLLLERIREKSPDVEIYMQSCIPEVSEKDEYNEKNLRIFEYNDTLRAFAKENGCHYIDLKYYIEDHQGKMPESYSQGNYHMNEAGCLTWMQILRYYAQYENEGGILE
nr:hypothetical protein [Oscillospiraceae bacterium]